MYRSVPNTVPSAMSQKLNSALDNIRRQHEPSVSTRRCYGTRHPYRSASSFPEPSCPPLINSQRFPTTQRSRPHNARDSLAKVETKTPTYSLRPRFSIISRPRRKIHGINHHGPAFLVWMSCLLLCTWSMILIWRNLQLLVWWLVRLSSRP
ncbi:hypothetical protein BD769DRAFT_701097 [Suillus cothurnatus]|nr:hypothetical protein BD769DRAFT_701097 [Suillus cothurnatus]